jgi:glucose/arabinose dehydrogenase
MSRFSRSLPALLAAVAGLGTFGAASAAALPRPPSSAQPKKAVSGKSFVLASAVTGLDAPTWIGHAPGDADGLWVAQQGGQLLRVQGRTATVRLSIADRITSDGERGLLGVAFLPGFATNRLVALNSTNLEGNTRVELWKLGDTPAQSQLVRTLLKVTQPYPNHNGGDLHFVGDRLFVGMGDGGAGDDPQRRAQNLKSKLGKILSATVTASSSPHWKIVAYGVRNPWRFSYDEPTKRLWFGDVGQNQIEEIDRISITSSKPLNLGWGPLEGGRANPAGGTQLRGNGKLVWPIASYTHADGCSVTGGSVYRGTKIPALAGRYVYGDYCSGKLWSFKATANGAVGKLRLEQATVPGLTTFGTGPDGELYAASQSGTVWALRAG